MLGLEPKATLAKNESFAKGSPTRGAVTAKPVTERLYRERLFLSDVGKV